MSEPQKKKLLFIKSPQHNLKAIENFLNKRNYDVFIETDIKEALVKISEVQADFAFVALDHSHPQIMTVPKILSQSTNAFVIPYVQTNSKEAIRKLEYGGFAQKLYPPLSGPAIERLVLKLIKDTSFDTEADPKQRKANAASTKEEMIQIKSKLLESFEQESNEKPTSAEVSSSVVIQKGVRGEMLKSKNEKLKQISTSALLPEQKEVLKKGFDEKIRASLEDMIETYQEFPNTKTNRGGDADADADQQSSTDLRRKNSYGFTAQSSENKIGSTSFETEQTEKTDPAKINTNQSATDVTKASIRDLLTEDSKSSSGSDQLTYTNEVTALSAAYCMTIQSTTCCGYLLICSDCQIDFSTSQSLIKDWLSENFENLADLEDSEQFEIQLANSQFKEWAQQKADHYEIVSKNENEILLSFFSIDPRSLIVDMNENELIEVPLQILPLESALTFSVYLHLPENKKYLLYTPTNQIFSALQKKRLIDKNIEKLYTPSEFEKEFRKLVAENHMNQLLASIKTETSA